MSLQRREFITLLGGAAAAWPLAARAQQRPDDRVRTWVDRFLHLLAEAASDKIAAFLREIVGQLGWTTQLPWLAATMNQRCFDGLRLMRQLPAVRELAQLDFGGIEQLRVSRGTMDAVSNKQDYSRDPRFVEALSNKVYYGPVYLTPSNREPDMTLSVAGARFDLGVSVVEVNLKLMWDVIAGMKVGEHGVAYVLDRQGRVIAHSDTSLFQHDFSGLSHVQAAQAVGFGPLSELVEPARDIEGRKVLATCARVQGAGWLVFVELPVEEANAPAQ